MKILSAEQLREADRYTIEHEPVSSLNLMERAATACYRRLEKLMGSSRKVLVFCGMGNNGGDGMVIARLLLENNFDAEAVIVHYAASFSKDAETMLRKLRDKFPSRIREIRKEQDIENTDIQVSDLVIDALMGTGISRPAEGLLWETIAFLNKTAGRIISIDVPSGLFADGSHPENDRVVCSSLTLSLQLPKLAFLLPENEKYVPQFELVDIGLHPAGINNQQSRHFYVTLHDISAFLKSRNRFSHKGSFGHALLMAGSKGKSGAAVISARACLRSGAGLLTLHSTRDTLSALLHHLPEAMGIEDPAGDHISELGKTDKYNAIAFGPGVGLEPDTQQVLKKLLHYYSGSLVIDADGLNILAENRTWLEFLPPGTILTPHPREFERLTKKHNDDLERLEALKQFSVRYNCIVVLKGAFTAIAMPDGNTFFNSSGNAGLAKAGTGDGLTGIILGLLARGYNAPQAALTGTFLHGFSADLLLKKHSVESILISDVIENLPKAFRKIEKEKKS